MRTERNKREYCEHCGTDFSHRSYADKIHHSNCCDHHNAWIATIRFKEAKTEKEKLYWLSDTIGIDTNIDRTSYKAIMEIFDCLVGMFGFGIPDYNTFEEKTFPEIVEYMLSKRKQVKTLFNKEVQDKIDEIDAGKNSEINELKSLLVK